METSTRRPRGLSLAVAFKIAKSLGVEFPEPLGFRQLTGTGLEAGGIVSTVPPPTSNAVLALLRALAALRGPSTTPDAGTHAAKTIVCLANSRKPPSGRCVAGREVTPSGFGPWIRPVSARPTQEISEEERRYKDGTDPRVLDIITIEMLSPQPQHHQQENHLIDDGYYWVKRGTVPWHDLQRAVEDPAGPLWPNGFSSTYGDNDRVPEDRSKALHRSLYLVRPNELTLVVASEGGDFGPARRRVRAKFNLCGRSYCLVVTDRWTEDQYLAKNDGETELDDALLCVSLGEVFHGFAYKLVAAVITPQRAR